MGEEVLAVALAAEPVLDRHLAVLEEELGHGRGAEAHLVDLAADVEAGEPRSTRNPLMPFGPFERSTVA